MILIVSIYLNDGSIKRIAAHSCVSRNILYRGRSLHSNGFYVFLQTINQFSVIAGLIYQYVGAISAMQSDTLPHILHLNLHISSPSLALLLTEVTLIASPGILSLCSTVTNLLIKTDEETTEILAL